MSECIAGKLSLGEITPSATEEYGRSVSCATEMPHYAE